ncbi:ABC transporter permease [Rubeoparvulum massiliense]|uniref:ABC transporter permease n=1 Tax=Rubeoparvulum massiliense TaxID=1631346 RepID=UPI00065E6D1C|nr:ABC transporter permease [Rubeoparvulum massiliense]
MSAALLGAWESGFIFAIMALGVYLSFRILDFPDLTVDGSFVTGAATAAMLIIQGVSPLIASLAALLAGFVAGVCTGLLHTKGHINPLLSGILMMISLYSINLRLMGGRSNLPLLKEETLLTGMESILPKLWSVLLPMLLVAMAMKLLLDWFLRTEVGLTLRATGDNKRMIRALSANTDRYVILGLGISNAYVAFAGGLYAQYVKFADIQMGVGMIIIGLASVIIGEALFGTKGIIWTTLAVVGGAIIYRMIYALALRVPFLQTGDMKLITAFIVIIALLLPKYLQEWRSRKGEKDAPVKANF